MSMPPPAYWTDRFEPLLDVEILRQRATVTVPVLTELDRMPVEKACRHLDMALRSVFHPNTQCLNLLQRLVGVAHAHCSAVYPDIRGFMNGVYASKAPLPEFALPICLTGLAGIGKTELLTTFRRIVGPDAEVIVGAEHPPFPIRKPWLATVQARQTARDVLRSLAQEDASPVELVEKCRRLAFQEGIPCLLGDELQFATGSATASTRVSQMLMSLGYIGIPFIFAANFSLVARLLGRPGEEQQRLLSDPIILLPDSSTSLDWQHTLLAQRDIAPGHLLFDPAIDAVELHSYTAGRKRAMAKLLLLAFRAEHARGGRVDCEAIERAYRSSGYSVYREESEILMRQAIQNRPDQKRKDLWCPIPLPKSQTIAFLNSSIAAQESAIAHAELSSSLSPVERKCAADAKRTLTGRGTTTGQVVSLKKKDKSTAESLKKNAGLYRDNL